MFRYLKIAGFILSTPFFAFSGELFLTIQQITFFAKKETIHILYHINGCCSFFL